jgi:spore germination cell wall hydrolase CwlJ-like protein
MKITIGVLVAVLTSGFVTAATDQEVVAITILAEARGEGQSGMYAVATVIAQRALNRKLTPRQVCLQNRVVRGKRIWQFSCWGTGKNLRDLLREPQAKYALRLGECLANNVKGIDRSYVGYADHYHNKNVKPYWLNNKLKIKTINNHIFYKLR